MSFVARYDGLCGDCKEAIHQGDRLEWVGETVVHLECIPESVREEVARPTCPTCWQVLSFSGACGCDPE